MSDFVYVGGGMIIDDGSDIENKREQMLLKRQSFKNGYIFISLPDQSRIAWRYLYEL